MRASRVSTFGAVLVFGVVLVFAAGRVLGDVSLPALQRASGYCLKAERAMKTGNLPRAREDLIRAVRIMPSLPAAHMGLGHLALTERRYADALREYEMARDGYVEMAQALLSLHVKEFMDSRYEIVALTDEIQKQARLAPVFYRLNRLEAAVDRLERMEAPGRSREQDPPPDIQFYMGNALFHLGRLEEATVAWRSCLVGDAHYGPAYQNLAVGYWMMGRLDDARATVATAERLGHPVDPGLRAEIERGDSAHRVD